MYVIKDPRLKTLTDIKYKQFKNWFDQRLEDAIAAAEQPDNKTDNPDSKYITTKTQAFSLIFWYNIQIVIYLDLSKQFLHTMSTVYLLIILKFFFCV